VASAALPLLYESSRPLYGLALSGVGHVSFITGSRQWPSHGRWLETAAFAIRPAMAESAAPSSVYTAAVTTAFL
jgi:hypothetical protein